jgi:hypothetical protein
MAHRTLNKDIKTKLSSSKIFFVKLSTLWKFERKFICSVIYLAVVYLGCNKGANSKI